MINIFPGDNDGVTCFIKNGLTMQMAARIMVLIFLSFF